jgi:DNA-binding NtrC family response regulator
LSPVPRGGSSTDPWDRIDLSGSLAEATTRAIGEVERRKVQQALGAAGGDRGRAADILQINFKTLEAKLRELRLDS